MQVVYPETGEEIGGLLRAAQSDGSTVAVRGGRTLEQILPVEGAAPDLLLDLSRMNRIRSIEKGNLLARVEAGAVTAAVHSAVEAEGLSYPPDPTSLDTSTIGGNIACAATGPHQLKYGGTRDFVLGLEVVLPSGQRVRTGADMQKSVAGYDMTRLLIGSGARLGVVTGAVLRLLPAPQCRRTVVCSLPGFSAGASVAMGIMKSGMTPAAMELLDHRCVEADRVSWTSLGLPRRGARGGEGVLLIELDGVEASVNRQQARIERLCAEQGDTVVVALTDPGRAKQAWGLRRGVLSRLMAAFPAWAMAIAAVIPERLLSAFSPAELPLASGRDESARVACFAHAGTGMLHLFAGLDPGMERDRDGAITLIRRMLEGLRGVGGTVLHTYGPARRVLDQHPSPSPVLDEIFDAIRRSFDPKGVMLP